MEGLPTAWVCSEKALETAEPSAVQMLCVPKAGRSGRQRGVAAPTTHQMLLLARSTFWGQIGQRPESQHTPRLPRSAQCRLLSPLPPIQSFWTHRGQGRESGFREEGVRRWPCLTLWAWPRPDRGEQRGPGASAPPSPAGGPGHGGRARLEPNLWPQTLKLYPGIAKIRVFGQDSTAALRSLGG